MAKCFLSYSAGYDHLKDPFRRLLEAVGFERPVDVFDGPDSNAVPDVVVQKIQMADAVVVLYGPREKPTKKVRTYYGAEWPREEAVLARGMGKPLLLIVHHGTLLPLTLAGYQTPAQFDFWDDRSFVNNVHNVVSHILDFKTRLDTLSGTYIASSGRRFRFRKAIARSHIHSIESETLEVYHEVVALKSCGIFQHSIDNARDETFEQPAPEQLKFSLEKRVGPKRSQLAMRFGRCNRSSIEYFVDVTPSLEPGEELGYWRSFQLHNSFPLTRAQLAERASSPGFSNEFPPNHYGDAWDVIYDIDILTRSILFPWQVKLADYGIRVVHYMTREENADETRRCRPFVQLKEDLGGLLLEMTIPQPLINHSYYLLYQPKD